MLAPLTSTNATVELIDAEKPASPRQRIQVKPSIVFWLEALWLAEAAAWPSQCNICCLLCWLFYSQACAKLGLGSWLPV